MSSVPMHGSLFLGPYKGYYGRAEYDRKEGFFHGEVTDTRDVITFVGDSPATLELEFKASVDDYLAFCKSRGESPDKPYSGKFVVRLEPAIHRALCIRAANSGVSLNHVVASALSELVAGDATNLAVGEVFKFDPVMLTSPLEFQALGTGTTALLSPLNQPSTDISALLRALSQSALPSASAATPVRTNG